MDGILALSPTFDTIGPLTRDVADANAIFAVLNGSVAYDLTGASLAGSRLLKPTDVVFDDLDSEVADAIDTALDKLRRAPVRKSSRAPVPEFSEALELTTECGNIISAEGYALWGEMFDRRSNEMYRGIIERFRLAKDLSAIQEETAQLGIKRLKAAYRQRVAGYHAVVLPTAPILPPPIADLIEDDAAYNAANIKSSRNTRMGNLMECCGVTLPCQPPGALPVGLQLMGRAHEEGKILRLAAAAEQALAA